MSDFKEVQLLPKDTDFDSLPLEFLCDHRDKIKAELKLLNNREKRNKLKINRHKRVLYAQLNGQTDPGHKKRLEKDIAELTQKCKTAFQKSLKAAKAAAASIAESATEVKPECTSAESSLQYRELILCARERNTEYFYRNKAEKYANLALQRQEVLLHHLSGQTVVTKFNISKDQIKAFIETFLK